MYQLLSGILDNCLQHYSTDSAHGYVLYLLHVTVILVGKVMDRKKRNMVKKKNYGMSCGPNSGTVMKKHFYCI